MCLLRGTDWMFNYNLGQCQSLKSIFFLVSFFKKLNETDYNRRGLGISNNLSLWIKTYVAVYICTTACSAKVV
jgi:hypothetical protein